MTLSSQLALTRAKVKRGGYGMSTKIHKIHGLRIGSNIK